MIIGTPLTDFTYAQECENGVAFFENWVYSQIQSGMLISTQSRNMLANKVHILNTSLSYYVWVVTLYFP